MNHLEEIRGKLSIEELVGGYVQLKKAGRNLKGLCPFHNDSRPSFMVSPEKGIAYCFSCNTGGDIFKFIQLIEKVEFPEAVRLLAERTGVRLPEYKPETQDEKKRMLMANEAATQYFQSQLGHSEAARMYFQNRNLTEVTLATFKLGFAPDSFSQLKDHLKNEGFTEKELLLAGLVSQRSVADTHTFDRFRGRVMFPICDHQGNIVGFGGRILLEGDPKYLNSPDTPLYNKSYVLYGLDLAKEAVKQHDLAIFVEGYMDVISCHQAGTKNVIATSGTALTPLQLKLIKRYTNNLAFAFDQDGPGMEATKRAIELAEDEGMNVKIILLNEAKDPDECIQKSKESWLKAVEQAVPVIDFYFAHAFKKFDKSNLEGKKAILEILLPIIGHYSTLLEQNEYLNRLAFELKIDVKFLWEDLKRVKSKNTYASPRKAITSSAERTVFSREDFLLAFILNFPEVYPLVISNLINFISENSHNEKIYKTLKSVYDSESRIEIGKVKEHLEPELQEKIDVLSLLIDEHYQDIDGEVAEKEVLILISNINKKSDQSLKQEYTFKIRSASNPDEINSLLKEYDEMLKLNRKV